MTAKTVGEARPAITATNIAAIVFLFAWFAFYYLLLKNRREAQKKRAPFT
jgi:hypothetical protein